MSGFSFLSTSLRKNVPEMAERSSRQPPLRGGATGGKPRDFVRG